MSACRPERITSMSQGHRILSTGLFSDAPCPPIHTGELESHSFLMGPLAGNSAEGERWISAQSL